MYRTGSGQKEETYVWDRFRLERREGCIGQVQDREKRRMYRTGSNQREEKNVQDRFRLERREGLIGQVQVKEKILLQTREIRTVLL